MKNFSLHVNLIEENKQHCLSVDSRGRTEYFFKNRKGLLTRKYEDMWQSSSVELRSLADAGKYFSKDLKIKLTGKVKEDFHFSPGKILRENELVIDSLQNLDLPTWQVVFRANHSKRILVKKESKKRESFFKYFSILIKLKLEDRWDFIEVGEGSVQGAKFNQDGLLTRVREIIENHKKSKHISFKDKVPVVLNAGDGAILFHEILGHSLEADYLYQGVSPISPADLGKKIVSPNVTLITGDKKDDFFKDIAYDDEGEAAKPIVLIKNGVLKNLIADSFHREMLNLKTGGFSRVMDFTGLPMPRMYALYLKPGKYHPGELIESTKYGVYAKEFGSGKVYFNKNLFYFNIKDAYLIENGRLSSPLGSVVVRGNIIETLNSVEKIADDFRYDKGSSYCFKNGQTINVRVGQPTVKINNLVVTKEIND